MGKFTHTGWGFAKKGTKILGHWGSKVNRHSESLAEESLLKGIKLLRHYGTKKKCHSELVSESHREQMLKQVQHDNMFVQSDKTFVQHDKGVMKKCAFTLSEVLIVLAVLGVVAAITIPDLIQDYREKALITALKKSYTVFSQAVDMAIAENGSITTWDIVPGNTGEGSLKLYNILKPYLRIEKDCGTESSKGKECFANSYKALFAQRFEYSPTTQSNYAKGMLVSGASFFVWSSLSCRIGGFCAYVGVDVNGKSGPNKAGVDFFWFYVYEDDGLQPAGYREYFPNAVCEYNNTSTSNGVACAYWAIKHENMDYLRKSGKYVGY